jgi:transposase
LGRLQSRLHRVQPGHRVILQHDNAKPHTAKLTKKLLDGFGWEILEHPPYSPDVAPSDFHLFRSMEHWLRGKKFLNDVELANSVICFFNSKDGDFYARGIDVLPSKWEEVIEEEGGYFNY